MAIGFYCNREVVITEPGTNVLEAAQLMRQYHVGTLVVAEKVDGIVRPKGIVTDRDLVLGVMAADLKPDTILVSDIMPDSLYTVRDEESVSETMRIMRSHGVRRILVVDWQGGLQGIVSVDDLIALLTEEMQELAKLIAREQERERATRK
ncbi:MAG: histidine kinase [Burkholderiaceae bacterium]|nr:histidine kinase [Burkholderiaceae bacterium]